MADEREQAWKAWANTPRDWTPGDPQIGELLHTGFNAGYVAAAASEQLAAIIRRHYENNDYDAWKGIAKAEKERRERAEAMVVALRECIPTTHEVGCNMFSKPWQPYNNEKCHCPRKRRVEVLADTATAAEDARRRFRLEGARELVQRYEAASHTLAPTAILKQELAAMEADRG